jgi:uncharacterized protein (TIGR03067 family)
VSYRAKRSEIGVKSFVKERLMKQYLFGFVVLAAVGGAVLADDKAEAEAKKLEGTWDVKSIEVKGKKIDAPEGKGGSIVFAKGMKVVMKDPGKPDKDGKYKLDTSKSPMQLDLIELKDGKDADVMQAIYEVKEDTLRLGFSAEGPKGKRPTEFKGDTVVILHLKRQKS